MPEKTLTVSAIKNGTVLDHIRLGAALKIFKFLNLPFGKYPVTIGLNFPSKSMGQKGLIKIQDRELTEEELGGVAFFSPQATVNIIRDYKLVKKFRVTLPAIIEKMISCPNPTCITNNERMATTFFTRPEKKEVLLQCKYCEKIFKQEEIKEYSAVN